MGVRKSDDYMKNYFVSQYEAIKDVDFSPLFQITDFRRKKSRWKEKIIWNCKFFINFVDFFIKMSIIYKCT